MKHSHKVSLIILALFFVAQIVGLAIVQQYTLGVNEATGETVYKELAIGERPPVEEDLSFIPILIGILIGTGLLLLLIKFKVFMVWKGFFFFAVFMALLVAFDAFIPTLWAGILALVLAGLKIFRPRIILHNLTEVFIYGGMAAIFVPLLSAFSASVLLILISIYDMYAVWKSKHMITLAKFQTEVKVFAGLLVPYQMQKGKPAKPTSKGKVKMVKVRTAMLGGGDIGFPLMFAGAMMSQYGFLKTLIIPVCASIALYGLLIKGDEKKFYPAMPFISIGCFVGYGILLLL
ncbi:MAG: hypothetical protein CMH61_01295 [Nanoarchaeota archaeon]|nr:hypothetical protein [Nanoarchaeota archaeon]|tara:strand:+ start:2734 stop:3603 length:870 start_codon:yes stop_codon:yes gene_type:complete